MAALVVGDRAQETCTTTGTGTLSLLGAVTQFQSFAAVGISTGNTTSYRTQFTVADQSGANWETSIGVYTTSGSTLTRATVLSSSNGGALVNFGAGTKFVFMDYSATMAVSGGGGGTYPTVQPTLNLDFANTKQLDPRITFVRNSTATYYDGQTTAMAEQNLLKYSQDFSNAAWQVASSGGGVTGIKTNNFAVAPDGTTTAARVQLDVSAGSVGAQSQVYQNYDCPSGVVLCSSSWIKTNDASTKTIMGFSATLSTPATITVTGTWQQLSALKTSAGATNNFQILLVNGTTSTTADLLVWGTQVEQRSSATAYTPTTTAAITNYIPQLMTAPAGVARFDCDPITRNSLGLLIEESRTNLLTYSSDFSNAVWIKSTSTLYYNYVIAPDGTQTATLLGPTVSVCPFHAATWVSGTSYTYSIFVKPVTGTTIGFRMNSMDSVGDQQWTFNSTTGVITKNSGIATATSTVTNIGNSWYRLSFTSTANQSATGYVSVESGTGFAVWGAQLEAGSFATSYIPTVASTVTRAADQANMTGTNFSSWYNQAQGSFCINADRSAIQDSSGAGGYGRILGNNGSTNSFLEYSPNTTVLNMSASSGVSFTIPVLNTTANVLNTIAMTYSSSGVSASANGSTAQTNTTRMNSADRLVIFGSGLNTYNSSGHIRKLSYYPVALSSSNLVALTS